MKDQELLELEELIDIFKKRREEVNQCLGDLESAYDRMQEDSILKAINVVKKQYGLLDLTIKHLSRYYDCLNDFRDNINKD